jgi:hypothetical protein
VRHPPGLLPEWKFTLGEAPDRVFTQLDERRIVCKSLHTARTSVTPILQKVIILQSLVALRGHIAWPGTCVSTSTDGQY